MPSWMAKKNVKVKERAQLKSQRKGKAARAVFYCMNEAELVETAVSYLTNGVCEHVVLPVHQQVGQKATNIAQKKEKPVSSKLTAKPMTKILEEEPSDCDDLETTYVSETDLDITEVETLPYTKSPQHLESKGEKTEAAQDDGGLMNVKAEINKETLQMPADENDALQLVREIFFT